MYTGGKNVRSKYIIDYGVTQVGLYFGDQFDIMFED
jgi:hypothetical protein